MEQATSKSYIRASLNSDTQKVLEVTFARIYIVLPLAGRPPWPGLSSSPVKPCEVLPGRKSNECVLLALCEVESNCPRSKGSGAAAKAAGEPKPG